MKPQPLTLDSLGDLVNGAARATINAALAAALLDLDDRGDDEKPRKVVITVEISRNRDSVVAFADVSAKTQVPPYRTPQTVGELTQVAPNRVEMRFRPDVPNRHDQPTLDEALND